MEVVEAIDTPVEVCDGRLLVAAGADVVGVDAGNAMAATTVITTSRLAGRAACRNDGSCSVHGDPLRGCIKGRNCESHEVDASVSIL